MYSRSVKISSVVRITHSSGSIIYEIVKNSYAWNEIAKFESVYNLAIQFTGNYSILLGQVVLIKHYEYLMENRRK